MTADQPIARQISVARRQVAEGGTDQLSPPDENQFIVFPPQIVLRSGQSQAVPAQWRGEANSTTELAFRIITEQLPINLHRERSGGAQVSLLLRYEGTLYVTPAGAKSSVAVDEARQEAGADGKPRLIVMVSNKGNRHTLLGNFRLQVTAAGRSVTMNAEQLEGMNGANMLAGGCRRFEVPWPDGLPVGPVQVSLDFEELI